MVAQTRTPRSTWIDAGLQALAAGGPDAVRVDLLAKELGVTRGGFYHHFSSRQALLDAMLERYGTLPYDAIRLEDLASDAGVTVQTLVRRFGGKPGLMIATVQREFGRVAADRAAATNSGEQPRASGSGVPAATIRA